MYIYNTCWLDILNDTITGLVRSVVVQLLQADETIGDISVWLVHGGSNSDKLR